VAKFFVIEEGYVAWHCPGCEGGHHVPVSGERAWGWNGSLESPTLTPSVLYNVGGANPTVPICHSIITGGKIAFCGDSTHKLAGQTVDVPDWEEQNKGVSR
jgi:hypothetical protein